MNPYCQKRGNSDLSRVLVKTPREKVCVALPALIYPLSNTHPADVGDWATRGASTGVSAIPCNRVGVFQWYSPNDGDWQITFQICACAASSSAAVELLWLAASQYADQTGIQAGASPVQRKYGCRAGAAQIGGWRRRIRNFA